ncbi:hypothetical protein OYE22_24545 [Streptomyces sp. 71268]|uniref:hypothetical protein n=1 Tax=Streptomyces sp. 71268 TaxID=3002640 RepID=UPI0023F62961|nr:hypothetical protein [Streptomyces sp. 71268]WEV27986.1 hypothetical protein OYE22_24545 [Streptomyces sp. 71268]
MLTARQQGHQDPEDALAGTWRLRLQQLLDQEPQFADELRRLLDEHLTPALEGKGFDRPHKVVQNATANDHSEIIQVGRDAHIHRPPRP